MIDFIICEDEIIFRKEYKKIINCIMMNTDIEYQILIYEDYNQSFEEYLVKETTNFRIYLLDIMTKTSSGLNIARKIREEYNDWNAMIMIITAHPEYKYIALEKRLMLLDFIVKQDNLKNRLEEGIHICLTHYNKRPNSLKFKYKSILYNIHYNKIYYIERIQNQKKCKIYTEDQEYEIINSIQGLEKILPKQFFRISRDMIININKIEKYHLITNTIVLKNKIKIHNLSRNKRKEFMTYVKNHS